MRSDRTSKSTKANRPSSAAGRQESSAVAAKQPLIEALLVAGTTCLLVATPLVPSESMVSEGTAAPLCLLWLLLAAAVAVHLLLSPGASVLVGWTGIAALAFVAWHTASGLVAGLAGNGRQSLNVTWQVICYALAALLVRHLFRTGEQARGLAVVFVALAAALSAQSLQEYFISKPADLAAFSADPEAVYQSLGVSSDSEKQMLRWRIESVEPLATFALTNSLAGFLAPWLVVLLGIGVSLVERRASWPSLVGAIALLIVIASALLLTKSRTGYLAAGVGTVLVALYGRTDGWRIDWKIPLAATGILVLLGLSAVAAGGLDLEVLSEAPLSVLYRLQYWQATAAMIADYPLFGCGPGQFQEYYARYKLPQASETVADPHNLLLEIWSTAGTPALLVALAIGAALAWQLGSRSKTQPVPELEPTEPPGAGVSRQSPQSSVAENPRGWIYGGAALGFVLAALVRAAFGYELQWETWLLGLPAAALAVWLLDDFVRSGTMPVGVPASGLVVLLVNLLAAGAFTFPGVMQSVCVLVPLMLLAGNVAAWNVSLSRAQSGLLLAFALALVVLFTSTGYLPVMRAAPLLERAGRPDQIAARWRAAAEADPWDPRPWRLLAELLAHRYALSGNPADRDQFLAAAEEYRERNPRHYGQFQSRGEWLLMVYSRSRQADDRNQAIEALRGAAGWYPGRAIHHLRLAWVLAAAGNVDEADREAELAAQLDEKNPHAEQKLAGQRLFTFDFGVLPQERPRELADLDAEQALQQLRTTLAQEPVR
jgi:O-antigen ligase/tetratricopeptide (TPR) repeat protein